MNTILGKEKIEEVTKVWRGLTQEVSQYVRQMQEQQKTSKLPSDYLNSLKKLQELQEVYNKAVAEANGKLKDYTAQQKEAQRIEKLTTTTKAKLVKATSAESKELNKLKIQLQQVQKEQKQEAQLSSRLVSEYTKQSIKLNQLRARYKDVALTQGESSKAAKNLERQVGRLDKRLKRVDASVGQFGRSVGNYPKLLGGATRSLRSFAAAFGFTSAIFILAQTVRNAANVFKEFDQSQADLAAILGRSRDEISALTEQAKELGATTAFTATQVAELQLELAKLGFNDEQILKATLGIENLAIATGVDAARAAKLGGAAIRGFNLEAEEANRVAAALAVSTTKSASSFETLEVALPKVSAIANSFGFTLEDTTALLGGLQNAGFEASIAGTSLRQIFLQLADSNGKLAQRLGGGAKNFDELIEQFKKVEKEGISLGEAFNLTNARSVAAFKVFLSGADDLKTLRDSIVDVEGELQILADEKLNSVQGRLTLLNSAWEGWILSLDESGEAAESLKKGIEFLTENLSKILNTIIKVGKAFFIYKAILIATSLITRAYAATTVALRIAKIALAGGIGKATRAMRLFNITTKANPIGILISVIAGGIAVFAAFKDGVNEATEALNRMKTSQEELTKSIVDSTIASVEAQLNQIDEEISNAKQANKEKIDLLTKNIEEQENGTANLYSTEEELQKESLDKQVEELKNKWIEEDKLRKERAEKLKNQKPLTPEELSNARLATPDEITNSLPEQLKDDGVSSSPFLEAERQVSEKLKALRRKLIKSLNKIQEDENKKANEQAIKDIFNLEKSRLKIQIDIADEETENLENSLDERFVANAVSLEKRLELLVLERDEAIRLANGRKNKITQINEEFERNQTKLEQKGADERLQILSNDFKKRIKEFSALQEAKGIELKNEENNLKESLLRQGVSTEEIQKQLTDFRRGVRKKELEDQIIFVEKELALAAFSAETKAEILKKLSKLKSQLLDIEFKESEDNEKSELEKLQEREEAIRNAFQGIGDALGVSGNNLATIFNGIENGFKNAGEAAQAFGQLASEVFSSVIEAQNARIEAQIQGLEAEKETALAFAGESGAGREEIEEQFDEKKRALQQKQAKNAKAAAIVDSIAGTASAVVSALGTKPFTPLNFALAATVGVIGAAQTAIIAAQQIPQFKDGVLDFSGGLAVLGDGGRSEIVRTPDGNIHKTPSTDTLYNLPKGTDVYKSETDFNKELNKMLNDNSIDYLPIKPVDREIIVENNGLSKQDLSEVIGDLKNSILGQPRESLTIDNTGFKKFVKAQNTRTKILNDRFRVIRRKV